MPKGHGACLPQGCMAWHGMPHGCTISSHREQRSLLLLDTAARCPQALLLACSPASMNREEAISTLRFGQRAKTVRDAEASKPVQPTEPTDKHRAPFQSPSPVRGQAMLSPRQSACRVPFERRWHGHSVSTDQYGVQGLSHVHTDMQWMRRSRTRSRSTRSAAWPSSKRSSRYHSEHCTRSKPKS